MENIYTVFITALTVLGSGAAFRFYEKRMDKKREDEFEFKYDCRDRIAKLEALLAESSIEKEYMRKTILELSTKVAELVTKIQYLENKK
jgi:hypothetical protein